MIISGNLVRRTELEVLKTRVAGQSGSINHTLELCDTEAAMLQWFLEHVSVQRRDIEEPDASFLVVITKKKLWHHAKVLLQVEVVILPSSKNLAVEPSTNIMISLVV